jgi:hypothetical protein
MGQKCYVFSGKVFHSECIYPFALPLAGIEFIEKLLTEITSAAIDH